MYQSTDLHLMSTIIYLILIFVSVIVSIVGSFLIISFFTRKSFDKKEEILKKKNIGVALVLGSFIWTIARMCLETVKPIMNAWYMNYESGFTFKTGAAFKIALRSVSSNKQKNEMLKSPHRYVINNTEAYIEADISHLEAMQSFEENKTKNKAG